MSGRSTPAIRRLFLHPDDAVCSAFGVFNRNSARMVEMDCGRLRAQLDAATTPGVLADSCVLYIESEGEPIMTRCMHGRGGEMASRVELKTFSVGPMDNNVYILVDADTRESVLFDAPVDSDRILAALQGTNLQYILFTHADGDHIEALQDVKEATAAPIGIDRREASRLPLEPDFEIHDGDVFRFGNSQVRAISTPGHSPGGISFLADGILIAGDTLFPGGPGNTQRPDGDFKEIIENIQSKLFTLPDDTKVYPGHGKPTTIGAERPHLQEWIQRGW